MDMDMYRAGEGDIQIWKCDGISRVKMSGNQDEKAAFSGQRGLSRRDVEGRDLYSTDEDRERSILGREGA